MKTRFALLLPLLALAACVNNHASVVVAGICAPPADATACTFSAKCDALTLEMSTIDVGKTSLLWLVIEVDNQMPNNTNTGTNRLDTNRAYIQEYEVEFAGALLPKATGPVPGSAVVPSNGTATVSITPVNQATGAALGALIPVGSTAVIDAVAKLRLKGVFGDTSSFETAEFQIPFRACRDCVSVITCTAPKVPIYCPNPAGGQVPMTPGCL